jgi:hypothetical protein
MKLAPTYTNKLDNLRDSSRRRKLPEWQKEMKKEFRRCAMTLLTNPEESTWATPSSLDMHVSRHGVEPFLRLQAPRSRCQPKSMGLSVSTKDDCWFAAENLKLAEN